MKLHPWQLELSEGFKKGELVAISAGRGAGKSALNHVYKMWEAVYKNQPVVGIDLSEGRVYGARYYTAEPTGGNWNDMATWCEQTFGPCSNVWEHLDCGRWYQNDRKFWFRNEADRTMFVLKWR